MKLSLVLSALLLGGAVIMSGCGGGSSSSNDQNTTGNSSSSVASSGSSSSSGTEASAPEFTTEMLAGKTFYNYGLGHGGQGTENRMVVEFNTDATGMTIHNHSDATDTFSVTGTNAVTDGKMHWSVPGMTPMTVTAVELLDDGSFIATMIDPDHFDPYPILFSSSELADKGQAVFTAYLAEQTLSKDDISASPWYSLDWSEVNNGGSVNCHARFTFKSDNSVDVDYVDENGQPQSMQNLTTYVISGNRLEYDTQNGEGQTEHTSMQPVIKGSNSIIWTTSTAWFKNRADAETFVNYLDPDNAAGCMQFFPEQ
jgi:hypothetical protein